MTWLTPGIGLLAAAIAVPTLLILYFLKLRRKDVEVSTTLLWRKAIQDLQANAPFQRLRRNLLLFLQLLVLAAALVAVAQPQSVTQRFETQRHIILIDRSASMGTLDVPNGRGGFLTRLEQARRAARAMVDELREGGVFSRDQADEAMVIAFDAGPQIVQQFTGDKARLRQAIDSVAASQTPTSIEATIAAAIAHLPKRLVEGQAIEGLTAGQPVTMHIFSDGRIPDATRAKPGPENPVEYHMIGAGTSGNVGITSLRAERSFDNPAQLTVYAGIENNEGADRRVDAEIMVNGRVAGIKNVTVPGAKDDRTSTPGVRAGAPDGAATAPGPGSEVPAAAEVWSRPGVAGVAFAMEEAGSVQIRVRLLSPGSGSALEMDTLAIDNEGFLAVPAAKRLAVAVVSSSANAFLDAALSGLPLSRLTQFTPTLWEETLRRGKAGEFDVVVLDGWVPEADVAGNPLSPGRYLVLGELPRGASGIVRKGDGGVGVIIDWARDHPAMKNLMLDDVQAGSMPVLEVSRDMGATVLAKGDRGPAIVEMQTPSVRAVVVGFDVMKSTWPLRVSYVVFLAQAVQYLGDEGSMQETGRQSQPGREVRDRLPAGAGDVEVRKLPDGERQSLTAAADGSIIFGPLGTTGLYEVSWKGAAGPTDQVEAGRAKRMYAVNLNDSAESDVRAATRLPLASKLALSSTQTRTEGVRRLWPWLLLGALLVLMVEWWVYNRKVYV